MNGESNSGAGIKVRLFGRTDVGQIREHNEDNFLVADLSRKSRSLMETDRVQAVGERGTLMGVCDGMGGAAAGEVASQLAVDIIYEKLTQGDAPRNHDDLARRLVNAVEEAGGRIFGEARADRTRRGMGTTATISALLDGRLFVAQVGDSRAYVLRGDKFVQVSRDQSLVNQLIEAGQLTEEEAETFEHNNIILQALGTAETVQVDLTYVDLRKGDTLLVCSDGLSGMVRADEMREVLLHFREPFDACKELVDRANRAGGHDNITVIVAVFEGALSDPGPQDVLAYQKYALPEAPAEATVRAPSVQPTEAYAPPPSQEAQRESRRLRVGHTMVGMTNPMATPATGTPLAHRVSNPPPTFNIEDDPVSIPTSGLPPSLVGMFVLVAMLLVAVAGFLLLRCSSADPMAEARAGKLTFRRVFPRLLRLVLTVTAVVLVGFYGAANGAKRPGSGWSFRALPVFVNVAPQDVRDRAVRAMRAAAHDGGPDAERARAELLRLGGAALPHVLPLLDSLEPSARGRVAMALGAVALRMRVASVDDVSSPERALLFFSRFWQDRSIEFRPTTVRRAVERLSERSLTLRRDDVIHADTYALEALVAALGNVEKPADVERVARLHPVLMHITDRGEALPRSPSMADAARAVEAWQRLWLEEGADYSVLEGPRRVAALVTETQYGKWLAQAVMWKLGRAHDGSKVSARVLAALPSSGFHVLLLLLLALAAAAGSALLDGTVGFAERALSRVTAMSASLVASYPVVLTLALSFELKTKQSGVLELCAQALRLGDVNLMMGALLGVTLLSELLVTLPSRLAAAGHAADAHEDDA